MDPDAAQKGCGGMAVMAIQCCFKVGRIGFGILSDRCHSIMTGFAVINDACMIKFRADEAAGVMTDATILTGCNMRGWFIDSETGTMTCRAVIHDACMTKTGGNKASGLVAVTAITVARYMVRRWRFASGSYTIMAECAVIHDARVVICGTDKGHGVMTHGAILAIRWKMSWSQSNRSNTIVARGAVICNTCMIKNGRYKAAAGHMADVAIFSGYHMRGIGLCILTGCIDTIVARITPFACHVGSIMVDIGIEEISCVMTYATITIGVMMNGCIRFSRSASRNIIRASIMAGDTVTGDVCVSKYRGKEYCNRMTKITILCCGQMAYRLDQFRPVRKELTDMAAFTTQGKAGVHIAHKYG